LPFPADSARIEFQSSLQLLAERARFLTGVDGVAIALEQEDTLLYCAVSGTSLAKPGAAVDVSNKAISTCIEAREAVSSTRMGGFALTVPVLRGERVTGFFRLEGPRGFDEQDIEEATRLAELTTIALDQREAAERVRSVLGEGADDLPLAPVTWHAADAAEAQPVSENSKHPALVPVTEIQACVSCGFPVSPGRRLCVECEQKPGVRTQPPADLFASATKQERWLSAHGYTIASLLLTALTAAVILWLRR
jgi:hypothetical protein